MNFKTWISENEFKKCKEIMNRYVGKIQKRGKRKKKRKQIEKFVYEISEDI